MENASKKIAFLYFLVSIAWIYLSGKAVEYFFHDSSPTERNWIEIFKGVGFVILTTVLLHKLISNYYKNLKKSERQYRDMFETNPNPMWIYDPVTLKFLKVNYATIVKYGYTEEEFLNMNILGIRSTEESARLITYLSETNNHEQAGVWKHTLKNGSVINVNIVSHDIIYNKQPAKLVLALDITEKDLYEKELEKQQSILKRVNGELRKIIYQLKLSQRKLNNTQKIAKIAGWTLNLQDNVFDFDDEFYILTNIPSPSNKTSLTLENLEKFIYPDDFHKIGNFFRNFNQGKTEGECIIKIKNGENWSFVKFGAFLSPDSNGFKILEGFIQDIDEFTKTNNENKRLGEIINKVKSMIIIFNKNGEIEWVNSAFTEITGYTREESIGKKPWDFITTPHSSKENLSIIERALAEMKDINIELENISKQGQHIWLQIDGNPIYDEKNNHTGYVSIGSEISERKHKEAKIKEQNRLLTQAAWVNSHQVRKPLASILGLIQLMQMAKNPKETEEYLNLLEVCGNELDDIIKASVSLIDSNRE